MAVATAGQELAWNRLARKFSVLLNAAASTNTKRLKNRSKIYYLYSTEKQNNNFCTMKKYIICRN